MTVYGHEFYAQRHRRTTHAAQTILSQVLSRYGQLRSVIDVGCGVGTWLSVAQSIGIEDVQGVDGPWVDQSLLQISTELFKSANFGDLELALRFDRRFDLAICLEVAEHIDSSQAEDFVRRLTDLADVVLFSAAVPRQGGVGHVNEQWPDYWISRFAAKGYEARDNLRHLIWNDAAIPWWYRQNLLVFVAPTVAERVPASGLDLGGLALVHPELYLESKGEISGRQAIDAIFGKLLGKLGLKG